MKTFKEFTEQADIKNHLVTCECDQCKFGKEIFITEEMYKAVQQEALQLLAAQFEKSQDYNARDAALELAHQIDIS